MRPCHGCQSERQQRQIECFAPDLQFSVAHLRHELGEFNEIDLGNGQAGVSMHTGTSATIANNSIFGNAHFPAANCGLLNQTGTPVDAAANDVCH